jgi:hypothetical protein
MSRLMRPLFAFALLALSSFARGDSVRLVAPADGATLRGGSFVELRWSSGQLPASTEEWEAFLSIDGGKYYAFRITPHLDIDLQRFTFIVPNVDTHDARILIRTGDEVRETHFEAPGSFSIVRDRTAEEIVGQPLRFGHGEAARDGDPAVVSWTEGARNGSGVTQQSSTTAPTPSLHSVARVTGDASPVVDPAETLVAARSITSRRQPARESHTQKAATAPIAVDLLLACRRRNI